MTNGLLVDKKGILQDVIGLAENWKSLMDRSGFDGGSIQEIQEFHKSPKGKEIDEAEQKLSDYMSSLSFDDVKMIQTVMYLGRDEDYDKSTGSSHFTYTWKSVVEECNRTNGSR